MGRAAKNLLHIRQHVQTAVIFELNHQGPRRSLEQHRGPPLSKRRMQPFAIRATPLPLNLAVKRRPTRRAMRRLHKIELPHTLHTQVPKPAWARDPHRGLTPRPHPLLLDEPATMHTRGRKHDITDPAHQSTERRVHE